MWGLRTQQYLSVDELLMWVSIQVAGCGAQVSLCVSSIVQTAKLMGHMFPGMGRIYGSGCQLLNDIIAISPTFFFLFYSFIMLYGWASELSSFRPHCFTSLLVKQINSPLLGFHFYLCLLLHFRENVCISIIWEFFSCGLFFFSKGFYNKCAWVIATWGFHSLHTQFFCLSEWLSPTFFSPRFVISKRTSQWEICKIGAAIRIRTLEAVIVLRVVFTLEV